MSTISISQADVQVKTKSNLSNRDEVLELADLCLERHNQARALFLASGDDRAWQLAEAAAEDRRALLEVGDGTI